jgi:hypothetical protein
VGGNDLCEALLDRGRVGDVGIVGCYLGGSVCVCK